MGNIDSLSIFLKDVRKYNKIKLTKDEEIELIKKAQKGDAKSIDLLVKKNLLWVISIANKYKNLGVEYEDLIAVGSQGLLMSINKFNLNLGVKFYTFSTWWISAYITKEINENSRVVRLPTNVYFNESKLKLDEQNKDKIIYTNINYLSLDDKYTNKNKYDNNETTIGDILQSDYPFFPVDNFSENDIFSEKNLIYKKIVKVLNEKEVYVFENVFGFKGEIKTFREISKNLKLSEERVRQIYLSGLRKCRCYILENNLTKKINNFYNE